MVQDTAFNFTGDKELGKLLKQLPDKVLRNVVRKSVTAASNVISRAAKNNARKIKRSGALVKSINKVVRTGKDKLSVYGYIGVTSRFEGTHEGETVRPPLYIHLVEEGFLNRQGGFTPGKHILRNAANENQPAAAQAFSSKLRQRIEIEAAKLRKKR